MTAMAFLFDERKSDANRVKHGIDFIAAQALWSDPRRVEIPARSVDEPRGLLLGTIDGKHWSAVFIRRGARIRIISVRRWRTEEVEIYEG